jgi:Protein of unknown function (DUF1570)
MPILSSFVPLRCRRVGRALIVLAFFASFSGCELTRILTLDPNDSKSEKALAKKPAPPSKYSFRQAPYTFSYDFDLNRNHPLFKDLEGLRDQLAKELHIPAGTTPIQVYLFEDKTHFDKFMQASFDNLPSDRRAFFIKQPRTVGGPEDLLVYAYWGEGERIQQDLRHELTHALLHSVLRDVPMWLDEGLAGCFELSPQLKGVNASHVEFYRRAIQDGTFKPDLARLESLLLVKQMNSPEYREAWAWTHLMLRSTPEAKKVLRNYLAQLKTNPRPGTLAPRLTEVFPSPEVALKKHLLELDVPEPLAATPPR